MNKLFYYGSANKWVGVGPNMDERVLGSKVCPLPSPPPFSTFGMDDRRTPNEEVLFLFETWLLQMISKKEETSNYTAFQGFLQARDMIGKIRQYYDPEGCEQ